MAKRISKPLTSKIDALCEEGNQLAKNKAYHDARKKYSDAYRLVPDPKTEWEATTWILASIGDVLFLEGNYEMAQRAFNDAVRCPSGLGNVFIHLRLGEISFELDDKKKAADELARAYMGGGRDAFKHEDPKYFSLVEKVLKPPHGMDRLP